METLNFLRRFDLSNFSVKMLLVANLIMALGVASTLLITAARHERIVLVPPHLEGKSEISWTSASPEYYKAWGFYVSHLIGNITPENLTYVIDALGDIFAPKIFPPLKAKLLAMGRDPAFNTATSMSYFVASRVLWEPGSQKVFVMGRYINSTATSTGGYDQHQNVVLECLFEMFEGKPLLTHFSSYPGTQPHTLAWRKSYEKEGLAEEMQRNARLEKELQDAGIEPNAALLQNMLTPPLYEEVPEVSKEDTTPLIGGPAPQETKR